MAHVKKVVFPFELLALTLLIVACGGEESTGTSEATGTSSESEGNENGNSGEIVELAVTSYLGAEHGQFAEVLTPLFEEIEEATEGRVVGEFYPGGALGPPDALYDLAANGNADLALGNYGYTPGKFPLTGVFDLPFLGTNAVEGTEIMLETHKQFQDEFTEEHKEAKIGWVFKTDAYHVMTTDKEVTSLDDMEGLKIRTPSPAGDRILELAGATPVSMSMGDVYESMQRGVIDGALVPASVLENFQIKDVANYILKGDFYSQSFFAVMNKDSWNQISSEDQQAIQEILGENGEKAAMLSAEVYDAEGNHGWEVAEEAGIEVYELSDKEKAEWREVLEPMVEEWIEDMEQEGLPGQEVYDTVHELSQK